MAPAICIFPCLLYGLVPIPFIPGISGFPTRNDQRRPVLAHVCPLGRPTQGGQTDAYCPWQAHGNFSLAETTSYACPQPTSVLICLPCRRLSDPPKPKVYNSYSVLLFLYLPCFPFFLYYSITIFSSIRFPHLPGLFSHKGNKPWQALAILFCKWLSIWRFQMHIYFFRTHA